MLGSAFAISLASTFPSIAKELSPPQTAKACAAAGGIWQDGTLIESCVAYLTSAIEPNHSPTNNAPDISSENTYEDRENEHLKSSDIETSDTERPLITEFDTQTKLNDSEIDPHQQTPPSEPLPIRRDDTLNSNDTNTPQTQKDIPK